jgi:GTP-binding protein
MQDISCRCFSTHRRRRRKLQSQNHAQKNTNNSKQQKQKKKTSTEHNKIALRPPKDYVKKLPNINEPSKMPTMLAPTASPYVYIAQPALVDPDESSALSEIDSSTLFAEATGPGGMSSMILANRGSFDYFSPKHDLKHEYPMHGVPEVAVLGRSNVGKSSLVNAILQKNLCITSKSPGRTRLPHYYGWTPTTALVAAAAAMGNEKRKISRNSTNNQVGHQRNDPALVRGYIVDLPGYGFGSAPRSVVEGWQKDTQDWLLHRRHEATVLKRLFLLMDARRDEHNEWDRTILRWLEDAEIPYTIVLTKADRVSVPTVVKQVNDFCVRYASQEAETQGNIIKQDQDGVTIPYVAQSPVVHVTSSKRGWGIAELALSIEIEFFEGGCDF